MRKINPAGLENIPSGVSLIGAEEKYIPHSNLQQKQHLTLCFVFLFFLKIVSSVRPFPPGRSESREDLQMQLEVQRTADTGQITRAVTLTRTSSPMPHLMSHLPLPLICLSVFIKRQPTTP